MNADYGQYRPGVPGVGDNRWSLACDWRRGLAPLMHRSRSAEEGHLSRGVGP